MATLYSSQSIADSSETTSGKIRIATNAEALIGTNDTTAMSPLKTAQAIAASSSGVTGALVYRGSYDASAGTPALTSAAKGDFYIVSTQGSLDAVPLNIGDHIVFNQAAANPVTSAMFDVIDNTDAVSSVNGQTGVVTLSASSVGALASGDNVSELTNNAGYITSNLSASITVDTDGAYDLGTESARFDKIFADLDGAVCFKASNASGAQITKGQPVYISGVSGDVPEVSLADADAAAMPSAGLAGETANAGAEIRIITFGNLTDVDTSSFSLGDTLYIDTTAGQLTATPPAGESAKLQNIGKVIRVHASSGIIKVGGAGRSAATPNLDQNKIFLGDVNNRAVSTALSSINVGSFNDDGTYLTSAPVSSVNTLTGAVVLSANDLAADHSASNYTASNANIDGHLAGIDTALGGLGTSAASETVAGIIEIATNAEATAATATDKAIVPSNLNSVNVSTLNNDAGYITSAPVSSVNTLTGAVVLSANDLDGDYTPTNYSATGTDNIALHLSGIDTALASAGAVTSVNTLTGAVVLSGNDLAADHTASNYTATNANIDGHLAGIDTALASAGGGGYTYSAVSTATNAQANYHYSVTGTTTITLPAASSNANSQIRVKNMGSNTVTIAVTGGDTIDGQSSASMPTQYQSLTFMCNGSNGWEIV